MSDFLNLSVPGHRSWTESACAVLAKLLDGRLVARSFPVFPLLAGVVAVAQPLQVV